MNKKEITIGLLLLYLGGKRSYIITYRNYIIKLIILINKINILNSLHKVIKVVIF